MQKLVTLTTTASLFMCISTSIFATSNQTEVENFSQTAQSTPAPVAASAKPAEPVTAPSVAPVQPPPQATTPVQAPAAVAMPAPIAPPPSQPEQAAPAEEPNTELALLSQRFDQFFNEYHQLQEQAKQKLEKLENENAELKNQLLVLEKQVTRLLDWQNSDASGLSRQDSIWLGVGFSVILIWLLVLTLRRQERPTVAPKQPIDPHISTHDETDIEDEYDYLGSEEGIAAKIDLARAYHDMGDIAQAREVLQDVLKVGNTEQKQAAAELLSQIEQAAVH